MNRDDEHEEFVVQRGELHLVAAALGMDMLASGSMPPWASELIYEGLIPPYATFRIMPEASIDHIKHLMADMSCNPSEHRLTLLRDALVLYAWAFGYGPGEAK